MRGQRRCEATYSAQPGWPDRRNLRPEHFAELTTPSAPTKEALQHRINVATFPSSARRGMLRSSNSFTPSMNAATVAQPGIIYLLYRAGIDL